jgi:DHA2 family multidrug resistance protein
VGCDEYLVANATVLCASSWLAQTFGRKRFYMACAAIFTISSVLRLLRPAPGVAALPCAAGVGRRRHGACIGIHSRHPSRRRSEGRHSLYGVAIVAPIVGPTLGGWITDNYSWHWVFLINAPVGGLSLGLVHVFVSRGHRQEIAASD